MDLLKGALKSLRINQQDVLQLQRRESLSKYKYVPLPSDKSIRLFEFHPANTGRGDIDLEMSIHSLEGAPSFECLSYMWGNPTLAFSRLAAQSNKEYGTDVEITISGGTLLVARNLHDALKVLRRRTGSHATTHYYWVDAICIDQENIAERGQQVAIMDNIYSTARNTTVWVGPEDEFTKDAVMLIRDIGKIPLSRHGEVSPQHFNTEQDSTLKRLGCKPQGHKRWLGLIALLNRPYFSRVWIVQEILLSNAVLLVCGKHEVPWTLLSNTISFLLTSGWYGSIGVLSFRELPFIMANPGVYKSMLEDKSLDIGMTVVQLETARTGMAQVGHLILFRHLLEAFRPSDASDARDKIYALIGLAWKERPPFSTHPDVLVPDYSLDTREVFIKTARLMFLGYGDLKYLCHVEDRSIRKMKGLPSWVPDYSVRLRPIPFYLLSSSGPRKYYSASKGLPFTIGNSTLLAPQLHVLGFRLSRIKSMAQFKSLFTDDAPAVWELDPAWYKVCTFAANITTLQKRTLPPTVTCAEILWRTMCADCAGRKAPAPADFESQFLIWLLYILIEPNFRHNGDGSRFNQMELQLALGSGRWRAKFPPVAALLRDNEAMQTAVDQMIEAIPNPSEMKYMIMPFLVAVGECHSSIRTHFVDEDERYGITTLSAEEGDEVWIVAGVDTPCVLRPARANEFEFIGEAYVHGIMMGELNDYGLLQETRDIVLV